MTAFNAKLSLVPRLLTLVCLAFSVAGPQPARAAGAWYVAPGGDDSNTCLSSSQPCATIDGAIGKAASGDSVYVAVGTYTGSTSDAVVTIGKDLTLSGGWEAGFTTQAGMSTIDGQGGRRGLTIYSYSKITVMLENFTIQNGHDPSEGGGVYSNGDYYTGGNNVTINHSLIKNNKSDWMGGGVYNSGTLTLNNTIVRDNTGGTSGSGGGGGGGIENYSGTLTLNNSVVSGNILGNFEGSGINNGGTLILNNATVSGNTGANEAIYTFGGTIELNSSTVAGNQGNGITVIADTVHLQNTIMANNSGLDCYNNLNGYNGKVISLGYNVIQTYQGCTVDTSDLTNIDPQLGPLQDNGGATLTHALLHSSPAINAGNPAGCSGSAGLLTTDQRGSPRVGRCDIGAYETPWRLTSNVTVSPAKAAPGDSLTYTITLTDGSESDINNVSLTDTLPDSLTYQDNSLIASTGFANYSAGAITWTGDVNSGSPVAITFKAKIDPKTSGGAEIINTVIIQGDGDTYSKLAKISVALFHYFLPWIAQPTPGIFGHVTFNGAPAPSVWLNLCFYNGSSWSLQAGTSTGADGSYAFSAVPGLSSGQAYYVRFMNQASLANGRLSMWETRLLTNYATREAVYIGDFDLADVPLISPYPGTNVALPATFQWMVRTATPGDSYQFELFDPSGSSDFTTPPLGYVNSYGLNSLPTGFATGTDYGWYVWVNSPDGGFGASFYYNPVTFSNTGYSLSQSLPTTVQRNLIERGEELLQRVAP